MQRYRCHKEVYAAQIAAALMNHDGSIILELRAKPTDISFRRLLPPEWVGKHHPGTIAGAEAFVGGYLVEYLNSDGYQSWSPQEVFEQGYRLVLGNEQGDLFGQEGGDPAQQMVMLINRIRAQNTQPVETDDVRLREIFKEINECEGAVLSFVDVTNIETDHGLKVDKRWMSIARTHIEQGFLALREAFTRANRR